MKLRVKKIKEGATCDIPRKHESIEALLILAWRKGKKDRPKWLSQEVNNYC